MAAPRIPTKPNALRDQLVQAAVGIGGEASWTPTAWRICKTGTGTSV